MPPPADRYVHRLCTRLSLLLQCGTAWPRKATIPVKRSVFHITVELVSNLSTGVLSGEFQGFYGLCHSEIIQPRMLLCMSLSNTTHFPGRMIWILPKSEDDWRPFTHAPTALNEMGCHLSFLRIILRTEPGQWIRKPQYISSTHIPGWTAPQEWGNFSLCGSLYFFCSACLRASEG